MFKAKAPKSLVGAAEKALGAWPKCKCGYPCEVRAIRIFKKDDDVRRATLVCVADECDTRHQVLFMP